MTRVRELTIAYRPHPSGAQADQRSACRPETAAAILIPMLEHQAEEVFLVLLLTTKCRVIAVHEISRGAVDQVHVHPGRIMRAALLANAPQVILAHNHPSGDPTPSPDDIGVTRAVVDAGRILEITVLDHLIIGDGTYCSLQATGRM